MNPKMTFYEKEVHRIKGLCYSNQAQIKAIIQIRKYIDNNFDANLNLDLLSRECLISKYHLLRLFKKYYGQTPKQYLIDKRIAKSKEFLKAGMTATQTCLTVGFESPSSFSSLFKCKVGMTPSEFQKSNF